MLESEGEKRDIIIKMESQIQMSRLFVGVSNITLWSPSEVKLVAELSYLDFEHVYCRISNIQGNRKHVRITGVFELSARIVIYKLHRYFFNSSIVWGMRFLIATVH